MVNMRLTLLSKLFSILAIILLIGCVTPVKTSSQNLSADIKWISNFEVAMTFPGWISEEENLSY